MSKVSQILLDDARAALVQKVTTVVGRNNLEEAFAAWLVPEQIAGLTIQGSAKLALTHTGAVRTYKDVAVLGLTSRAGSIEPDQQAALLAGLQWLAGREPFLDGSPMGFCLDAVALLGISLGAKSTTEETTKKAIADWMGKFITRSYEMLQGWQKCLLVAAQREASVSSNLPMPSEPAFADIRVALRAKGILSQPEQVVEEDERHTLTLVKTDLNSRLGPVQAALRLAAIDWLKRSTPIITPNLITVAQVVEMLRRVPFALRRWTWEDQPRTTRRGAQARKWYIDNEYHVQNLLWMILAPIFPDLKDEEYLPGIASLHPRTDICIPFLKLIIEVKFMRASMTPQELIEQIAADTSLYLTNSSGYKGIIAFIWDDTRRSEQHDFMIQGLKRLNGIIDVIVVSRPGAMMENAEVTI